MSYRRNGPSRNILLHTAAEVFSGLGAAAAAALLVAGIGCAGCSREGAPAQAAGAATAQRAGGDPKAGAGPKLRFDPEKADHSDLAVFETVVERIALRSDAPVDWRLIEVDSSCDCLVAHFVETSDPKRAVVELTFFSDNVEEIDGIVYARWVRSKEEIAKNGQGDLLATYIAKVVTRRVPFVMPRAIVLEKGGSGRFELVIGQSFPRDAKAPISIFRDVHCDEERLNLEDVKDDEPTTIEGYPLCRTRIPFEVHESARASPFTTKVKLEFGVPSVEKTVVVEWK